MRVTGGIARGIQLRVPTQGGVRPATDYIREAVFNSLAAFVPGVKERQADREERMWGPPVEAFVKIRAKAEGATEAAIKAEIESRIPLREIVPDEAVADAALFLASDDAVNVTGVLLPVDGGYVAK